MYKGIISICFLFSSFLCVAQTSQYQPLDPENPITFNGDHIVFQKEKIQLGASSFFIDGQLSDKEANKYPYVFNSVHEAVRQLKDGSEKTPMTLYLAPYVYWIDDPDDPAVRVPEKGDRLPFGMKITCDWLRFQGLTDDPQKVILASNRGQTMGAKGNFTMFYISGEGTSAENLTFGNYCNIDLVYPLKPSLNRKKRGSAIVQAQLIFCNGDKIVARNTHFISRLNLCPFIGAKRVLFDRCHFESTDDALNGSAVYLNCTFEFYGSKPFYRTTGTGAVMLNCDIRSFTRGEQYFTKAGGQLALVDVRIESETVSSVGWNGYPINTARNYQYNVRLNGKPVLVDESRSAATIDMTGKPVLDAYRFQYKGQTVYNIYNLLRGEDGWDPMGLEEVVRKAEKANGKSYSLPVRLTIASSADTIETGKDRALITPEIMRSGGYPGVVGEVDWNVEKGRESFIELEIKKEGVWAFGRNEQDEEKQVNVIASTTSGLEAATSLTVRPPVLEAPEFSVLPRIQWGPEGVLTLEYKLDTHFSDHSLITWYRCSDAAGSAPVETAVSRFNKPRTRYRLSEGDIGSNVMAKIKPKHIRSDAGEAVAVITKKPASETDISPARDQMIVDLESLSTKVQPTVRPGYWLVDAFKPEDTRAYNWLPDGSRDPWRYGSGVDGAAADTGLIQAVQGARLLYTPVGEKFGDMKVSFTAVPAKTAGQGFSSARAQYMDIFIKFDNKTLSGYALRLVRTTKYHNTIDFVLMKYDQGKAIPIGQPVSTDCYRPDCRIEVGIKGNRFYARAATDADYFVLPGRPGVTQSVDINTEVATNDFGGMGFLHTGTVGSGATLIRDLKIEWENRAANVKYEK